MRPIVAKTQDNDPYTHASNNKSRLYSHNFRDPFSNSIISFAGRYNNRAVPACGSAGAHTTRRGRDDLAAAAITGVVASHVLWVVYMLTPFGNAGDRLAGMNVISFYSSLLH